MPRYENLVFKQSPLHYLNPIKTDPSYDPSSVKSLRFEHNNNKGFDVYAAPPYKMPVLVPDSANAVSLKMKTFLMDPSQKKLNERAR